MGLTDENREAIISYRLNKSMEVLNEAIDVARLGHWNLVVNRLYYSIFHACNALLLGKGLYPKSHGGVIRLVMMELVRPGILSREEGTLISTLFNMRTTGDYDDLFDWLENDVAPLIDPVRALLKKINCLAKND